MASLRWTFCEKCAVSKGYSFYHVNLFSQQAHVWCIVSVNQSFQWSFNGGGTVVKATANYIFQPFPK